MANLIADALRVETRADVALLNGGGLRANALHMAGAAITRRDIQREMPFGNVGMMLEVSGETLLAAMCRASARSAR